MSHPTSVRLTDDERQALEKYRQKHGLRSLNDAIKKLIADASK